MLKVVIFDKDGVLIDSERGKYIAMSRALASFGYVNIRGFENWFFSRVGVPGLESTERCIKQFNLRGADSNAIYEKTESIRREMIENEPAPVIESSVAFLKSLPEDLKIGVASSDFPDNIRKHVGRAGILKYIDVITSGEKSSGEVERDKPYPDIYLATAKKLGVLPEECVAIEDTSPGINAVRAAGMYCIGFRNPNSGEQDYSDANCVTDNLTSILIQELRDALS